MAELGMIGLGRMGGNMSVRLVQGGHRVVGYARRKEQVDEFASRGVTPAYSIAELVQKLKTPRLVWLMMPAGAPTEDAMHEVAALLAPGDTIIDGGNSYYKDTVRRSEWAEKNGLKFIDVGTSGGIWGLKEGYSMMVGGIPGDVERLRPLLETLAPGPSTGWGRVGGHGTGHFVKMVHNGIEYGLMEAYGEGFAVLRAKEEFGLDLVQIADIWRFGSVVRSWLLDLSADAMRAEPGLESIAPYVEDSGEGRWTVKESIDLNIAAPVMMLALERRIRSREADPFVEKLLSAMRQQFGGHAIRSEGKNAGSGR